MATVSDILAAKGRSVHQARRDETVYDAIERMVHHNIGALVVVDGGEVCGLVTERDYLGRVALRGRASKTTRVDEIMTTKVVCVHAGMDVEECMQIMTERRTRHLPVVSGRHLIGIVSIGDLVKSLMQEQAWNIEGLTGYIQGRA
jgi:CBS domain-containing protein